MKKASVLLTILVLFSLPAAAGWILVPVSAPLALPGAQGSLWTVRLTAYNSSDLLIRIGPQEECNLAACEQEFVDSGASMEVPLGRTVPSVSGLGEFLHVTPGAESIDFYYRTRDESRRLETAGTMLPILREEDAPTGDLVLIGVPFEERFRTMLRLYGLTGPETVAVSLFAMTGGEPLASFSVPLMQVADLDDAPAQAQVPDLGSMIPGYAGEVRVHVGVEDGSSVWGFATVTHNETQHVTVVEAQ